MNCATFSASAPAITSMFPPTARDSSSSGGPRPCWPSCKPHDETSPHVREHRLYLLARVLTEPSSVSWRVRRLDQDLSRGPHGVLIRKRRTPSACYLQAIYRRTGLMARLLRGLACPSKRPHRAAAGSPHRQLSPVSRGVRGNRTQRPHRSRTTPCFQKGS